MTKPSAPRSPRRSNADYRWTNVKISFFLHVLTETGSVAEAARRCEMTRQSAYRLRARIRPEFAAAWEKGRAEGRARWAVARKLAR